MSPTQGSFLLMTILCQGGILKANGYNSNMFIGVGVWEFC